MALTLAQRLSFKRFIRGEPAQRQHIELNHRRIFILPNGAGLSLGLVILLMLVASINYNNSLGFIFTFLLAAAAQTSSFYSYKNLSGLIVSISQSSDCYVGENSHITIKLQDPQQRERWQLLASHLKQDHAFQLLGREENHIHLSIEPRQRGWYKAQTITLSSSFPLGIFRAWSPLLFEHAILVYPQAINHGLPLTFSQSGLGRVARSSRLTGSDDFLGLKPYQAGENYRHINWKALAAEKGFYSNEFSREQPSNIVLDWASCRDLVLEDKLSQLCYWVIQCEKKGHQYGLRLPGIDVQPSKGIQHQRRCLKELALYEN